MKKPIPIHDASFVMSAREVGELPAPTFAELVFAGKSNVGKSSLINTLVDRRKLARVSATPGCTRGINVFRIERGDAVVHFVDLPGYGYAQRSKSERKAWGPMIEGFLQKRVNLSLVVVIIDVRRGLTEDDSQLLDFLDSLNHQSVVVATKLDKLPPSKQKPALSGINRQAGRKVVGFSSETGAGKDQLLSFLFQSAGAELAEQDQPRDGASGAAAATDHSDL